MDPSHSSSSSSSIDDASMDDSDREHSFEYGIDDAEEEEEDDVHEDYEDVPEDDDDDDDDDIEDEDEEEEDDDAIYVEPHPMVTPISISDSITANFSNTLSELRTLRTRSEIPIFSRALAGSPSANGLQIDQFYAETPLLTLPRIVGHGDSSSHDNHVLRSVFLDTFDSLAPGHSSRHYTRHDFFRSPDSLASLTARLRGGLSATLQPRYFLNPIEDSNPPSAVHPMLYRPRTAPDLSALLNGDAVLTPFRRGAPQVPSAILEVDPDGLMPASLTSSMDASASTDMRVRIAESFDDIRRTLNSVEGRNGMASSPSEPISQPAQEMQPPGPSRSAVQERASSQDVGRQLESAPTDEIQPMRASGAGPSTGGAQSAGGASVSMEDRPVGEDVTSPAGDDGPSRDVRGNREVLRELVEQDLARSVETSGVSPAMESILGMFSRRNPFDRFAPRDRDREKIPSGIQKRWLYDPPSYGGDSLPSIFDTNMLQKHGRHGNRTTSADAAMPVIAPQSHEAVNQLSTKIINRVDTLLSDMMKIDMKVTEQERKEKAKKEAAEKKKKADEEKAKKGEGKTENSETEKEEQDNPAEEETPMVVASEDAAPVENEDGETGDTRQMNAEEELPDAATTELAEVEAEQERDAEVNNESNDAVMLTAGNDQGGIDDEETENYMQEEVQAENNEEEDADAENRMQEEPQSESHMQEEAPPEESELENAPQAGSQSDGADAVNGDGQNGDGQNAGEPTEGAPAATDFSAVAAQRAAAAGISLEAPANENPEVVAAATESTGIDPAFLAALPEDMRAEILTQYYEQIWTSNPSGSGASSSPQATTVNQDFLIALPPALRAEVLELEAAFQSRQNEGGTGGNNGASGSNQAGQGGSGGGMEGAEMDNATFLATLAPDLRAEILLTSGEAFIQSLPPNMVAEARALREREVRNRLPWRVPSDFPVGFDGRRLAYGARGRGGNNGRSGGRNQPREAPVYHWRKVGNKWLREVPKAEDEPKSSLETNGLSALMQLLWLRQGHYGKTFLYQVFSHACKNSPSRLSVLEQLMNVVTAQPSDETIDDMGKGLDVDRSRQHGVAVRRALEILILLCKNDAVVAETLLGLPRTEEELAQIPSTVSEHTVIPLGDSKISLSNLVSLLGTSLFERSNSHLEQLVGLISTLCQALPATLYDESDRRNDGRSSLRRRRAGIRAGLTQELQESMNILLVDADVDGDGDSHHPVFHIAEDGDDDDDDDSEDDPFDAPVAPAERESSSRRETTPEEGKGDAEKDVGIPPQYRIPGFQHDDLVALTRVLLRQGCSERTYDRVSRSIGILGELVPIRITFVDSLVSMAVDAGQGIHKDYERFITGIEGSSEPKSELKRSDVISAFSVASASDELKLLRVVKSLSALWEHEAEENADEVEEESEKSECTDTVDDAKVNGEKLKDSERSEQQLTSTERRFRPSMLSGLQPLWSALDRLLELVSNEAGLKDKKASGTSRNRPSAADMINADRIRAPNRTLSPVLARLSPMIEAFLVTHSVDEPRLTRKRSPSPHETPGTPSRVSSSPLDVHPPPLPLKAPKFEGDSLAKGVDGQLAAFVERHRGPINALLRANPSLLESSFKGALKHSHAIDFDNKKAYFRNVIRRRSSEAHAGTIRINVRRDRVFDDSYQQLRGKSPDEMKGRLHVQFNGEEGVDAGGVTREWYVILARQIFDPNYVLFTRSAAKAAAYQPDKRSYIVGDYLDYFKFAGRIIGKAIYDGQLLDAYFTRSFYKHILGLKPTYHDIEAQDPEYYKSLKWMLENDITGILDYTMSSEYDEFGKQTIIDLMPNGRNIPVTEENKADYVRLVTEVRMTKAIEKQIEAFKEGFYELIPYEDLKIFNELELELLMSGLPDIDMADLKANVEYTGYTASSPQVNWFWRCVGKMDQEDLARLVMFVTGTSKVPLEGFSQLQGMNGVQKFQIHRVGGDSLRLPSAHTCFNQLDLPEYGTAEILSERLLRAVRECNVGFGFA